MLVRLGVIGLAFLLIPSASAQTPGSCAPAQAEAILDLGNIRARILNNGNLFGGPGGRPWYEAPKGSGIEPLGIVNFQIGGVVEDTMRVAAPYWGPAEFWPGPIPEDGSPPDSTSCAAHDRIWQVTRRDIEAFKRVGSLTRDLAEWPFHLGAPVVDGDGDPNNYNLNGDDLPAILGDQTFWWVMNDLGNQHRWSSSLPLGVEVRATAFVFNKPGALQNATFHRYQLRYRGKRVSAETFVGLWVTAFLGGNEDDYAGADTTLDMGYFYNAEEVDRVYGAAPPAVGVVLLQGPKMETGTRLGMTALMYSPDDDGHDGVPTGNPEENRHVMNGRSRYGHPIREMGQGYLQTSGEITTFMFPGDPVTGSHWSMENPNNDGSRAQKTDGMVHLYSGPFRMEPGDEQDILFATMWSRGEDRLDSVRKLRDDVRFLRSISDELLESSVEAFPRTVTHELGFAEAYPNPFSEQTTIRYSVPQTMRVSLSVFDVLGREVRTLVDGLREAGDYTVDFKSESLAPGVYVYRFQMDQLVASRLMVVVR